jgi:hypothetical protein
MKVTAWAAAIVSFFNENIYFGWNASPKSDAELIADCLVLLTLAVACAASVADRR